MKGLSLIEIIIALALVVVTITIFGVALSSVPLTKTARNQNLAYHIAAEKIEELRNTPFASLPAAGSSFANPALANLPAGSAAFTIQNYQSDSKIKQVTVTVSWVDAGKTRSVVLETLMSERGLNQS